MKTRLAYWLFIIAILAGSLLRGADLLQPYEDRHRGSCAAFFALMAMNHLRYGVLTTGGVGVLNPDRPTTEDHFNYYVHHPPGAILLATVGALIGGTNPSGLRLAFLPFAIGIILLVHRLARRRGRATAAAAGAIVALTPIGVYYGAFVNFEIPTLFFILLTLRLFLRYHRRGRRKDFYRSLVAYAAAVFCDWIALGLPLCLLVLLPFQNRGRKTRERPTSPIGHSALLIGVGILVVLAVQAQVLIQLHRYGMAPGSGTIYYQSVTPLAPGFDWQLYLEKMGEYFSVLYGWPVLLLALLGLMPSLLRLARRSLDDADLAGLVMLIIGLANLIILANHARGHDYYQLYLLPAVGLFAASILPFPRRLDATSTTSLWRKLGVCGLILLLAWQSFRSVELLAERRTFRLSALASRIADSTPPGSIVILSRYTTVQVPVAAGRFVHFASNLAELEHATQQAWNFGMQGDPILYLISRDHQDVVGSDLMTYIEKKGKRSEVGPFTVYDLGPLRNKR